MIAAPPGAEVIKQDMGATVSETSLSTPRERERTLC